MANRSCSRNGCTQPAVATLTYVYADQTAVIGSLAPEHIPGSYDLCAKHCEQLSAPRGWQVVRLTGPVAGPGRPEPDPADDLWALAEAVREVGLGPDEVPPGPPPAQDPSEVVVLAEKGHLRMIAEARPGR